jgi:hypothetical protein
MSRGSIHVGVRSRSLAVLALAAFGAALIVPADVQAETEQGSPLLVRVHAETGVPAAYTDRAAHLAARLLTSAGIRSRWLNCTATGACLAVDEAAHVVTVILRRSAVHAPQRCASAARDRHRRASTVLVHMSCIADVVHQIQWSPTGRSHPLLSRLEVDEVLGLVLAHELGHAGGLGHTDTGVMRARLDIDDILAFRSGTLTFTGPEAATLRASLGGPSSGFGVHASR